MSVTGRLVRLHNNRLVFVGTDNERMDRVYLGFRNAEGDDTKLSLSVDAWQALQQLARGEMVGEGPCDFPHKTYWRVVTTDEPSKETEATA